MISMIQDSINMIIDKYCDNKKVSEAEYEDIKKRD